MVPNPRILIFTETFHPITGGGETQARVLAENLVNNGFETTVLTRRTHSSHKDVERYGKFIVYRLPPVGSNQVDKWGLFLSSIPALIRLRGEYDLIFVSGFRRVGFSAVLISKLLGKPCVLKADSLGEMSGDYFADGLDKLGLNPKSFLFRIFLFLRNFILRKATAFVAISSDVASELIMHGLNPNLVHKIPNGVDTSRFHPVEPGERQALRQKLAIPEREKIVIFTGRLVSYKGLPLLVRVWQEIQRKHRDVGLLLVGSGGFDIHNCEAELKAYVDTNGLQDSVHFKGDVHNVHEHLQASDIFVFPTENEAFGISLIEAMACGLPVIATPVGGIKDILQHQHNGLAVQPSDFRQLYDALEVMIIDSSLSARLGNAAWQTVQGRYSSESVTREYAELFTRISNSAGNPPARVSQRSSESA